MSTDFDAVCDTCKQVVHAGQVSAGLPAFGHASTDDEWRLAVTEWVFEHAYHGMGVRIVVSDSSSVRRSDDYTRVEL